MRPAIDFAALKALPSGEIDFAILETPPVDVDDHPIDRGCEHWASTCTSCPHPACIKHEETGNGPSDLVRRGFYLQQTRAPVFVDACPRCRGVGLKGAVIMDGDGEIRCLTCSRPLVMVAKGT